MLVETETTRIKELDLYDITKEGSERGTPLIIDIGCLAPREDDGIYGKENPLERRCRAARAFGRKGEYIATALDEYSNGIIYFPSIAHTSI